MCVNYGDVLIGSWLKKSFLFILLFFKCFFKCIVDLMFIFISGYLVSGMYNGGDVGREIFIFRNRSYFLIKIINL